MQQRVVVAIPARDEEERLGLCLDALKAQRGAACDVVVVVLNNCRDRSAEVIRARSRELPFRVRVEEREFPAELAHAGTARGVALAIAADEAGPDGLVLTTDADGMAEPAWIANTLAAFSRGAEVVCGRAVLDPDERAQIPSHLHEDDVKECRYGMLLDEIHHHLDPDPDDPWPRHTEHSGASIAVTVEAWTRSGGVPAVSGGEDRAFLRALRRVDARVRHAPDVAVTVSARTVGRASGGMAETIARRMVKQDAFVDASLEPVSTCVLRASLRRELRSVYASRDEHTLRLLAWRAAVPPDIIRVRLALPYFGEAWDTLAALSPRLAPIAVARRDIPAYIDQAEAILAKLCHSVHPMAEPVR